jgi:hypothetical protein
VLVEVLVLVGVLLVLVEAAGFLAGVLRAVGAVGVLAEVGVRAEVDVPDVAVAEAAPVVA